MIYFEAKSVINREVLEEVKWHIPTPKEKMIFALRPLSGLLLVPAGFLLGLHVISIFGFLLFAAALLSYPWHLNRVIKLDLDRAEEMTGIRERESEVSFLDDAIKIHDAKLNNTSEINYNHFSRFAKTDNLYVLFTKTNVFLPINRTSIIAKQDDVQFGKFIKNKCTNIKW